MTYIRPLNNLRVVMERILTPPFSNFLRSCTLLYSLISIFTALFLKRYILQNWTWRDSIFSHVVVTTFQILLQSFFLLFNYIYIWATGRMLKSLIIFLQDTCLWTPPIIPVTLFCNLNMLYLSLSSPTKIIPYPRSA